MNVLLNIRGTQNQDPNGIEIGKDTVYIRENSKKIEEDDFIGWEYDEKQYNKDEYIKLIADTNNKSKQIISDFLEIVMENGVI